ncbi:MAG: 2-hydroxyacyl-CoA dehydratase [Chloroflexi bacterium]|nr:2-hydroxyacyl-CoA dehydratase [Chloroflexota bacterium]
MLKHVPCLVDPREAFGGGGNASPLHPEKSLAYARAKLEELRERAARGFSALPEEKLRTIWTVTGYNNDRAPLDYLASRGVALLMRTDDGIIKGCGFLPTYGDESQFGRKLSPLEEQARELLNGFWLALKEQWVVAITRLITELKCDFLINFVQSGCTQTIGLARIVEETVQKELGTPSLHVEGRSLFSEGYNREAVLRQFGDFIDMMLAKKGLHN